jgi:hypothetical protein
MASSTGIDLGLPSIPETRNAELFPELVKVYSAINTLAFAVEAYTGTTLVPPDEQATTPPTSTVLLQNMSKYYIKAYEAIGSGLMVNIFKDVDNVFKARLADASAAKKYFASGFNGSAAVAAGGTVEVTMLGLMGAYSGLAGNNIYYLGVAGVLSSAKPVGSGVLVQPVGYALADNLFIFNPSLYTTVNP